MAAALEGLNPVREKESAYKFRLETREEVFRG